LSLWSLFFGKPPKPSVWVLKENHRENWHKVVSYEKPVPYMRLDYYLIGPLRSETDAEELADRLNSRTYCFYGEVPPVPQKEEAEDE